jgi:serine/threonine-protein kinase
MQGTALGFNVSFSPDGRWVAFYAPFDRQLKKIPVDGGPAVVVAQIPQSGSGIPLLRGASWGTDDPIVYAAGADGGIFRVSADGGAPERVTTLNAERSERWHGLPQLLPGGRTLLYTALSGAGDTTQTRVVALRFDTGEQSTLLEDAADARFLPSGHLLYMRRGTLLAAPFDAERLEVTGSQVAVLDDVMQAIGAYNSGDETYRGQFQVSASGTLVYLTGGLFPPLTTELLWMERDGTAELAFTATDTTQPRISPDGSRIATHAFAGRSSGSFVGASDIWVYDVGRSSSTRLTFGGTNNGPVWSPAGRDLLFSKLGTGTAELFRVAADGSTAPMPVTATEATGRAGTWSQTDVVALLGGDGQRSQIWTLPMSGNAEASLFLESPFRLSYPAFSPDGRWLAYTSNESGADEVYVQAYPRSGARTRISTDGGLGPMWSGDGRELFYTRPAAPNSGRQQMVAVDVDTADGFRAGRPRALFESDFAQTGPFRNYDVTPDGRRFIVARTAPESLPPPVTQMHVVLNWTAELERRVPVN